MERESVFMEKTSRMEDEDGIVTRHAGTCPSSSCNFFQAAEENAVDIPRAPKSHEDKAAPEDAVRRLRVSFFTGESP
jgi:hypothetical protein